MATTSDIGSYRKDGPASMYEGALAIGPHVRSLRSRVLGLFRTYGALTDAELLAWYRHHYLGGEYRSISTRRRELVDFGIVRDSGTYRINERTNVKNIVWEIGESKPKERPICPHCGGLL
jgi:hypothetical protein